MFSFLSHSKLEKQSANDFYIGKLLCLPHSFKMNNKKRNPSASLVTHFHVYKCRFIYTSILQRRQNKGLRHFFLNRNNKNAVWSKKGTEEKHDCSSQQRPCHMIDPSSSLSCWPDMTSLLSEFLS